MTLAELQNLGASLLDWSVLLAVAILLLVVVLVVGRGRLKQAWLNLKTRYRLNHLGLREIANFRFPDGLGDYFTVDRLIMRPDGISLLMYIQYPGSIFCADDIDEWTQMLEGKSYRFRNPLVDLDYQIKAISARVPDVSVNGFLFFSHQAEFPKGCPERVINMETLPPSLKRNKKVKAEPSVISAWEKLSASL